jgi:hypothetical protein
VLPPEQAAVRADAAVRMRIDLNMFNLGSG